MPIRFLQSLKLEDWRVVGAAGQPTFANSWTNLSSPNYPTAAFFKDPYGIVHLRGLVTAGTMGQTIFVLPVGYRPVSTGNPIPHFHYAVATSGGYGMCRVEGETGNVHANSGSNGWYDLAGIRFRAVA